MSARFAVCLALALIGTWAAAAPAAALEPGVFADPGSPAGKEYTAPLSTLRGQGSGHPAVENQPQPLFGSGITPPRARERAGGRASRALATRKQTARVRHGMASGGRRTAGAQKPAPAMLKAGSSAAPTVDLLVAAVVVGGLVLGGLVVAVRRRLE